MTAPFSLVSRLKMRIALYFHPALVWRWIKESRVAFCSFLAAAMVATRLVSFDFEEFFQLRSVPNHDMAAAIPFFSTTVHSVRLTGDIAWWNPVSYGGHGYAQYYQS